MNALHQVQISSLPHIGSGKVRELYAVDDQHMLMVATDRLSAFDVVLLDPIPGKGIALNALSNFWFARMRNVIRNHISDMALEELPLTQREFADLRGRSVIVRRLKPLPVEAVVRRYLIGSGWEEYLRTGTVCGIRLPEGLPQAARLPEPIFTPATKASAGGHDENIDFAHVESLIGGELAQQVRAAALRLYAEAAEFALERDIIIADTKFEFGLDEAGELRLMDEALTPDSSRFWPIQGYRTGISPPSLDKQYVRDYLEGLDWDKTAPGPRLPVELIENTGRKYREIADLLGCRMPAV
ncbi:MAG: phosphoribosylaminoimidazolesuccinocarboxamide synthase [Candidatus Eutrophobiaceae bacterium]